MKKLAALFTAVILSITALTGCNSQPQDPGAPPANVIDPGVPGANTGEGSDSANPNRVNIIENAVSVRIGNNGKKDWYVNMYDNAAAGTMLGYLSGSELRFPTYNYNGDQGFVAQSVRGTYTRDDEITVEDVKAGELYLFSDRQLRFYFKDSAGVNITATPIGYYVETDGLADAVIDAYTSNLGDYWGVDVYFNIKKRIK